MSDFKIKDCFFSKRLTKEDDAKNRHKRLKHLDEKGFKYKIFNNGNHVRINNCVDWYPSTAYWKSLDRTKNGYGFHPLLEFLGNYKPIEIKEVIATPSEKEEFERMTEQKEYKVGDEVILKCKIIGTDPTGGTVRVNFEHTNEGKWIDVKDIHSPAPKEPVESATTEKTPIIGYDFGEVGGDKSVEFTIHFVMKDEKVVRFSAEELRNYRIAITYCKAALKIINLLDEDYAVLNDTRLDELEKKLMGA